MKNLFFIFILIILALSSYAEEASQYQSLEWQKIELESKIRNKYEKALAPIMTSKKYFINVDIKLKGELSVAPDAAKKDAQPKLRPTNLAPDKAPEDTIVFSKLGMQAPVVGNNDDSSETTDIKKRAVDLAKAFDIFSYIESIKVNVMLDEKLDEQTRDAVKNIIDKIDLRYNKRVEKASITYVSMEEKRVPPKPVVVEKPKVVPPTFWEKAIPWISKFNNAIGLIAAVFLFGCFLYLLFKPYLDLQKEKLEFFKKQTKKVENKNEENSKISGSTTGAPSPVTEVESVAYLARFKHFIEKSPDEAKMLIAKWIKESSVESTNALKAIVKQLSTEELVSIFEMFNLAERKKWKERIEGDILDQEIREANAYMSKQIVDNIMTPPLITDPEIQEVLTNIDAKQGADIVNFDLELGSILLNVMNAKFVADVMKIISAEKIESVIKLAVEFDRSKLAEKLEHFKASLPTIKSVLYRSPFLENILNLISMSNKDNEKFLYRVLAQSESETVVAQTALNNYPFELIPMLGLPIVKTVLNKMPQAQRIKFLYTLESSQKDEWIELCAPEGTKTRDLFNLEFEKIEMTPSLKDDVLMETALLYDEYTQQARIIIRNSPDLMRSLKPNVEQWILTLDPNYVALVEESISEITDDLADLDKIAA